MAKYNYTQPANELQRFADMVEFPDAEPTENSAQLVTSGGVYDAIQAVEEEAKQLSYASLMEDTASGSIATFPDGAEGVPVKELTAEIEPIQDLHGYDYPWPAGGGKNKLNSNGAASKTDHGITYTKNSDGSITATGTASSTSYYDVATNLTLPAGSYILTGGKSADRKIYAVTGSSYTTDTGAGAAFTTDGTKTYKVTIEIASGQDLSAGVTFHPMIRLSTEADATFAPYSNICPISGYTGAEISVTGINVWDEEWELGIINVSTGQNQFSNANIRSKNYIPVKAGATYYFNNYKLREPACYDTNKIFIGSASATAVSNTAWLLTMPDNTAFLRFDLDASYGTTYGNNISINYPSTDTDYHAYNGTVYSVSWTDHGTIYKGTAQYKGGGEWEITADYGEKVFDGTELWSYDATYSRFGLTNISGMKLAPVRTLNIMSDMFMTIDDGRAISAVPFESVYNDANAAIVFIKTALTTDAAQFASFMSGHSIVYPLATPVTFTVSGPDPETLLGDNNIWSNTGDISVKYRCNTALYIEKKLG